MRSPQDEHQTQPGPERRGSPRILRRVTLHIDAEDGVTCYATATVINRAGAFVLSPKPFRKKSKIVVTNLENGTSLPFRVVWCGDKVGNLHKLGMELLLATADFWGAAYNPESTAE